MGYNKKMRLLLVNDEEHLVNTLSEILTDDGYKVTVMKSGSDAMASFDQNPCHLAVVDENLADMSGISLLKKIKATSPDTEVIMITGFASVENAIAVLREGAYDYLLKSFEELEHISEVVKRAAEKRMLVEQNRTLMAELRKNNEALEEDNRMLNQLAMVDIETGMYDETYLGERLEAEMKRALRYSHSLSLVMIDILPLVGKDGVDKKSWVTPKELGELLRSKLRRTDLVVRFRKERFVLLLPETPLDGCAIVCEKVKAIFRSECRSKVGERESRMDLCTVGIAEFPRDGEDIASLIAHAEQEIKKEMNR